VFAESDDKNEGTTRQHERDHYKYHVVAMPDGPHNIAGLASPGCVSKPLANHVDKLGTNQPQTKP